MNGERGNWMAFGLGAGVIGAGDWFKDLFKP